MADMLVKLYELPSLEPAVERCAAAGVTVRRAMPYEKSIVLDWIEREFTVGWRDEVAAAFAAPPIPCFIATEDGRVVGFAAFDTTLRGFFGPTGVAETHRRRGIGNALLLASLHALAAAGYGYGIIGGVGEVPRPFYERAVGAVTIAGSVPGVYRDWLTADVHAAVV